MIRFNCPHCNRPYELHPALAHLPLLCKQCGERITPPEAVPEPPPPPAPPQAKAKPVQPVTEAAAPPLKVEPVVKVPVKPLAPPPKDDEDDEDDGILVSKPDESPDIDFNVGGPTAASLSDASRAKPAGLSDANRPRPAEPAPAASQGDSINLDLLPPEPPPPVKRRVSKVAPKPVEPEPDVAPGKSGATLLPFVADLLSLVVLLAGGMMLGEMLAQKPTGRILSEAGSAPKFPPLELLFWAMPPAALALFYLLLSGRQLTPGAWVRRRADRA